MQGIIEEQHITPRRSAVRNRQSRGGISALRQPRLQWRPTDVWSDTGTSAAAPQKFDAAPAMEGTRFDMPEYRTAASQPAVPASRSHQRLVRRRVGQTWVRRFVRNRQTLIERVAERRSILPPPCYLAMLLAVPLALTVLAVLLNTVIDSRSLVLNRIGVSLQGNSELALSAGVASRADGVGGDPLGIDPTPYEKIRRTEYVVAPGDTISEIAESFDLNAGTILAMNPIDDVRRLLPGTVLYIPDRDGLPHAAQPGESLAGIAEFYGVDMIALVDANDVESPVLQVGDVLFIPGATMNDQDYLLAIGELFSWPVRSFTFTSGFGTRVHPISGTWHLHTGIDLSNRIGTPVLAAGSGRVVHREEQASNYGKMVIIDHGNGYRTLYAHLDSFSVVNGEYVTTGEQIGTMGNSGRSTGSHLHFSVFRGSQPIDPTSQLGRR